MKAQTHKLSRGEAGSCVIPALQKSRKMLFSSNEFQNSCGSSSFCKERSNNNDHRSGTDDNISCVALRGSGRLCESPSASEAALSQRAGLIPPATSAEITAFPRVHSSVASSLSHAYAFTRTASQTRARGVAHQGPYGADGRPQDFHWTTQPISHPLRRRAILSRYPEIEKLYGHDVREGLFASAVLLVNFFVGFYSIRVWGVSGWALALLTCLVSATLNHILFLAMHEACHRALFPKPWQNQLLAIFSNLVMGVPAGMGFVRYHLDHHVYMGVDALDPDIPTELEARLFRTTLGKFIFLLLLPLTYTLRPMLRNPKMMTLLEVFNWTLILVWDALLWKVLGLNGILYFVGGTLFSLSLHPLNGHLIAEHYQFPSGEPLQETYSTYDFIGNLLTFNAGYHLEHHDFPRVPGFRLPQLHRLAKEFYAPLPHHKSWLFVTWKFLFDKRVSPFSRVKRTASRGGPVPPPHIPFLVSKCGAQTQQVAAGATGGKDDDVEQPLQQPLQGQHEREHFQQAGSPPSRDACEGQQARKHPHPHLDKRGQHQHEGLEEVHVRRAATLSHEYLETDPTSVSAYWAAVKQYLT